MHAGVGTGCRCPRRRGCARTTACSTLLVPPPSPQIAEAIERILAPHDALEEGPSGVYAQCDALAGEEAAALVERLRAAPAIPQRAHQDGPLVRAQVERALEVLAARGR